MTLIGLWYSYNYIDESYCSVLERCRRLVKWVGLLRRRWKSQSSSRDNIQQSGKCSATWGCCKSTSIGLWYSYNIDIVLLSA